MRGEGKKGGGGTSSVTGFVLVAMKTQKTCCWFVSHPIYYIGEDDEKTL